MAPNKQQIPNPIGVSSPRPARQFTNQQQQQGGNAAGQQSHSSVLKQHNSEDSNQSSGANPQQQSNNNNIGNRQQQKQTGQKQSSKSFTQQHNKSNNKASSSNGGANMSSSADAADNASSSNNNENNNKASENNNSGRNNNNNALHQQQQQQTVSDNNDYANDNNDDTEGRELASKCLLFASKRFYLDVKQNKRGRFIKIAEVSFNGRKSRIIFSMDTTREFCDLLQSFHDFNAEYEGTHKSDGEDHQSDERIKSERLQKGTRLYYFDLKENARGRYLRCTQFSTHAPSPRFQITIPEPHFIQFRNSLLELLEEFGSPNDSEHSDSAPPQQHQGNKNSKPQRRPRSPRQHSANNNTNGMPNNGVESGNEGSKDYVLKSNKKKFVFDVENNQLGSFVRITQVSGVQRISITIPDDLLIKFGELFNKCAGEAEQLTSTA